MCSTCTCFWWGNRLGGITLLLCKLEWCTTRAKRKELQGSWFPFWSPWCSLIQTVRRRLVVGCHIYTGCSVFWLNTRADSSNELTELSLTPQVCFIPPPCLTHYCSTARMLLIQGICFGLHFSPIEQEWMSLIRKKNLLPVFVNKLDELSFDPPCSLCISLCSDAQFMPTCPNSLLEASCPSW